jgi:hypothetical protein
MHCTLCEMKDIPATTEISPMNKLRQIDTSSLLTETSSSVYLIWTCISLLHSYIYQLHSCIYQLHSCTFQLHTCIYSLHPRSLFHSLPIQPSNSCATSSTSTQLFDCTRRFQDYAIRNNHISHLVTA